ncbi:MAG: hypothetical protein FWF51_10540 [Chitinivibrionia bacterium]|nr:hypothetical protein [Chitinivibrionia bacterium]
MDEAQEKAKDDVEKLIDKSEKKIDNYAKEAMSIVENMRRQKIYDLTKNESLNTKNESLEEKEKRKEEIKEKASELKNDPKANPYEKSIAEAAENYFSCKYENALKYYEDIIKYYKDEITVTTLLQIYFRMAYMYSEMSDTEEKIEKKKNLLLKARDKYNEVLKLDKKNAKTYSNLGNVFAKRADLETEPGKKEISLNEAEKYCLECKSLGGGVYNLACIYARKYNLNGNTIYKDNTFKYLKEALEKKEKTFDFVENDKDFDSLKNDSRYKELKNDYGEDN